MQKDIRPLEIIIANHLDIDFYRDAKVERKAHGHIVVDGEEVASTMMCPHCNGHFISVRNSGIKRHWCTNCNAVCCGNEACIPCVPYEKLLEAIEKHDKINRNYQDWMGI